MKKLLLILLCLPFIGFGQNEYKIKVEQVPHNPYEIDNSGIHNAIDKAIERKRQRDNDRKNAEESARKERQRQREREEDNRRAEEAARIEAMKETSTVINIDLLINNSNKYSTVILNNITGHMPYENMEKIKDVLHSSKVIKIELSTETSQEANKRLYLDWHRERLDKFSRLSIITLNDSEGKTIYKATHKNLSFNEILSPLLYEYKMSKERATAEIKNAKELLDLGVLSQQEFNKIKEELKPILLGK